MKIALYIAAVLTMLLPTAGAAHDMLFQENVQVATGEHLSGRIFAENGRTAANNVRQNDDVSAGDDGTAAVDGKRGDDISSDLRRTAPKDQGQRDDISSEDVRAAAAELFAERFPLQAQHMQVRVERIGSKAHGASPVRIRLNQSDAIPKGHTQVRLLSESPGGGWSETGWALLYVAHFDSIAIAQRDLSKNDPVEGGDLSFAWMETTTYRGKPLTPDQYRKLAYGGLFAARPIRSGESVRVDDVRLPFAVDTGEMLTMRYERNGIILKVTCQAREPGVAGDVIRAYNSDTRTTYKVELTGPRAANWISTL